MYPKYEYRNTAIYVDRRKVLEPCPARFHTHTEVLFLTSGQAEVTIGGVHYVLRTGDIYMVFPGVPHGIENAAGSAVVIIADMAHHPVLHDILTHKLPKEYVLRKGQYPEVVAAGFARIGHLPKDVLHRQALLESYTAMLVGELLATMELTERNLDDSLLHKLILFLLDHYDQAIHLEDAAKALGYSKFYISRLISDAFGCNFRTLLNTYRVSKARSLLTGTTQPVSEVACACGFENQSSFNRIFRQECGLTPSQYRRKKGPPPEVPVLHIR